MVNDPNIEHSQESKWILDKIVEGTRINTVFIYPFNELRDKETATVELFEALANMNVCEPDEVVDWDNMAILLSKDTEFGLRLLLLDRKLTEKDASVFSLNMQKGLFYIGMQVDTEGNIFSIVSNNIDPEFRLAEVNMIAGHHMLNNALMGIILRNSYFDHTVDGYPFLKKGKPDLEYDFENVEGDEEGHIVNKDGKKKLKKEILNEIKELLKGKSLIQTNLTKKGYESFDLSESFLRDSLERLGFPKERLDSLKARIYAYHSEKGEFGLFLVEKQFKDSEVIGSKEMHCGIGISAKGKLNFYVSTDYGVQEEMVSEKDAGLRYYEFINRLLFCVRCLNSK